MVDFFILWLIYPQNNVKFKLDWVGLMCKEDWLWNLENLKLICFSIAPVSKGKTKSIDYNESFSELALKNLFISGDSFSFISMSWGYCNFIHLLSQHLIHCHNIPCTCDKNVDIQNNRMQCFFTVSKLGRYTCAHA